MKKRTIWTKLGDFLEGRGFYIVLALCIVAIGGSGYYLYRMISLSDQLSNQTVSAQASVPAEGADQKTDTEQAVEDAVKAPPTGQLPPRRRRRRRPRPPPPRPRRRTPPRAPRATRI